MRTKTKILCKRYKVYEDYMKFDIKQAENPKSPEWLKTSFPKESGENSDLHKPVLNKIKTINK